MSDQITGSTRPKASGDFCHECGGLRRHAFGPYRRCRRDRECLQAELLEMMEPAMATDPTKNSADPVCEWSATLIERDKLKVAVKKAVGCIRNGNPDYALEILEDAIDV